VKLKSVFTHHLFWEITGLLILVMGLRTPWACSSGWGDLTWFCPNAFDVYDFYRFIIEAGADFARFSGWNLIIATFFIFLILLLSPKLSSKYRSIGLLVTSAEILLVTRTTYLNLLLHILWWRALPRLEGAHTMRSGLLIVMIGAVLIFISEVYNVSKDRIVLKLR